jgi:hypothetical protein
MDGRLLLFLNARRVSDTQPQFREILEKKISSDIIIVFLHLAQGWKVHGNSQCIVSNVPYPEDRTDNPIFNSGGFSGQYTLAKCKSLCMDPSQVDPRGRPCVAIEWSAHSDNGQTANCALAWGCESTASWSGGQTLILEQPGISI